MLATTIAAEVHRFFKGVSSGEIEIYNEFSFQHELGCFIRHSLTAPLRVQFKRPVSFFQPPTMKYEKKEIDIAVFSADKSDRIAIELKFPRNGQYPEQMFSSCCDIAVLEQLVAGGFQGGLFIMVVDDRGFRQGRESDGIYAPFRRGGPIQGVIRKPAGTQVRTVEVRGPHAVRWEPIGGELRYCMVAIG